MNIAFFLLHYVEQKLHKFEGEVKFWRKWQILLEKGSGWFTYLGPRCTRSFRCLLFAVKCYFPMKLKYLEILILRIAGSLAPATCAIRWIRHWRKELILNEDYLSVQEPYTHFFVARRYFLKFTLKLGFIMKISTKIDEYVAID